MSFFETIFRLLLSAVLGGVVGWERSHQQKPAGFRTHILVCLGSTLFMLTSIFLHEEYKGMGPADPGRIAAQVVTGIGFIGAGTIWVSAGSVRGLTTAASLWTAAGVGLAVGCGFYSAAIATILIVLTVLMALSRLETRLKNHLGQDDEP